MAMSRRYSNHFTYHSSFHSLVFIMHLLLQTTSLLAVLSSATAAAIEKRAVTCNADHVNFVNQRAQHAVYFCDFYLSTQVLSGGIGLYIQLTKTQPTSQFPICTTRSIGLMECMRMHCGYSEHSKKLSHSHSTLRYELQLIHEDIGG